MKPLLIMVATALVLCAQTPVSKPIPKFETASVEPCVNVPNDPGGGSNSDSRLSIACWNLAELINTAYVTYARGKFHGNNAPVPVEQLNGWASSQLFTIEAVAEGSPGQEMLRGPMLQKLLEERFGLKLHSATKLDTAYALIVGAGGVKLKPLAGGCTPINPMHPPEAPIRNACAREATDTVASLDIFAWMLHGMKPMLLDTPVVNKTGLAGFYHFNMEPIIGLANQAHATVAEVSAAVQTYGLKLEATKAPQLYYVVDRVQQPK